jgi:hypothetical protein
LTYPPQPPQPGGQFLQSGPQPSGQFPSGGQPAQSGFGAPASGQFPQSGPQPGFDQAAYQQQTGAPGPYGPDYGGQPSKKSPLPWILGGGIGLVVIIGLVVVLLVVLGGNPGDPRATAQEFVDKLNAKQFDQLPPLACESQKQQAEELVDEYNPEKMADELRTMGMTESQIQRVLDSMQFNLQLGEVTENGDTATAKVSGTFSVTVDMFGVSESHTENIDESFRLVVEDGEWKVC